MQQTQTSTRRHWKRRALSLLMAAVMVLGLCPAFPGTQASAAHWADPYLSQLVEWGVISTAQAQNPDRALTRADFMGIVNRAYGYHEIGEMPFEDVAVTDWYYDDVGIAYNAQYIKGTSPTTASPKDPLTRETATTILGRNMMLQDSAGEILDFTDARRISTWAQGTIKSSLEHYLVSGYDDGTFRPQRNVSWGEMASMVTRLIGTPLQEAGDYSLGGTFGNVTITSPGVTLRDTVVSGDLYITGGVGLGGVQLENVTVLGRIIASGTGSSEGGASILLRNVTADELLVDNLQGNEVSLRADGITEIGRTTVRTSAYIEDNTPEGLGLHMISLEGESYPEGEEPEDWEPIKLTLAGRIEEVVNRTPGSTVHVGSGTVAKLKVDEAAVGSNVIIDRGAVVQDLILDTAVEVTGKGDVARLEVNAPGCVVEMLPDQIEIRPGITAEINGEEMDTVAGKESSEEPQILAGYPQAQDVVPTGLDAAFMTNKSGTIYWAVSAITDGSVGADDLIKPPSYGSIAVRTGSVKVPQGNEEIISKVTGLTPGGSYYLSAVLVDARDRRSPVKVISFTTPDNTVPAFCAGYPKMSKVSRTDSVVAVMPTKDCKLYYALLPQGAAAPTADELKTGAVSGALGYGVQDVKKNIDDAFRVNDVILDETTTYVLYLWLTDGVNSSAIISLTFTTDDETRPTFIIKPYMERATANSVTMKFQISEPGTVYWVAFPSGSVKYFPTGEPESGDKVAPWTSPWAIQQVVNGMNIGPDGKSGQVNVKADKDGNCIGTFNITGMKPETSYDVYFIAKDNAGPDRNYCISIDMVTVSATDNSPPTIKQSFSHTLDSSEKTKNPYADTAIYFDISENVGFEGGRSFIDLYKDIEDAAGEEQTRARNLLAATLHDAIQLMYIDQELQTPVEVGVITNSSQLIDKPFEEQPDVVIDYTQAIVEYYPQGSSSIRITFPDSALHLKYGGHYYANIQGLTDNSASHNSMQPAGGVVNYENCEEYGHDVKDFYVQFATVEFSEPILKGGTLPIDVTTGQPVQMTKSVNFRMDPRSTSDLDDLYSYDIVIWTDNKLGISYDLYYRVVDKKNNPIYDSNAGEYPANAGTAEEPITNYLLPKTDEIEPDENGWIYLGPSSPPPSMGSEWSGRSVNRFFSGCDANDYSMLNEFSDQLYYDFIISVTQFDGKTDTSTWRGQANFYINVAAGQSVNLINLPDRPSPSDWDALEKRNILGGLQSIGHWDGAGAAGVDSDTMLAYRNLSPSGLPSFINPSPTFTTTENSVTINLGLRDLGDVYYAISEVDDDGQAKLDTIRAVMKEDLDADNDPLSNVTLRDGEFSDPYFISGGGVKDEFADQLDEDRRLMVVTLNDPQPPRDGGINDERPIRPWMKGGGPTAESTPDSPMGKNLIVSPTNETIVAKLMDQDDVAAADKYTPSKDGRTDYLVPKELKADTDYFIYLVITLPDKPADMSHVYLYHFKTQKPMLPRVSLSGERETIQGENGKKETVKTGSVIMNIDTITEGYYRVFMEQWALDDAFLSAPFNEWTAHKGTDTDKTPDIYMGDDFTVLKALTEPYSFRTASKDDPNYNSGEFYYPNDYINDPDPKAKDNGYWEYDVGYHVFDMYADEEAKRTLYGIISDQNPQSRTDGKTAEKGKDLTNDPEGADNVDTLLDFGEPLDDGVYVILTYSINPNMKDLDANNANHPNNTYRIAAFSALTFDKGKVGAPQPVSVWGQMYKSSGVYSGSIEVIFDRPTYISSLPSLTSLGSLSGDALFTAGESNRLNVMRPTDGTVVPGSPTATSFALTYNGAAKTATIRFPGKYFTDSERDSKDAQLRVVIEDYKGQESVVVYWGSDIIANPVPIVEGAARELLIRGSVQGNDPPILTLDLANTKTAELTAEVSQTGGLKDGTLEYRWGFVGGDDVVALSPTSTTTDGKVTVTGKIPGVATIVASGSGEREAGGGREDFPKKNVQVIVKGTIDTISPITLKIGETNELTIMANGKSLSSSAKVNVTCPDNVSCTPLDGGKLKITSNNKTNKDGDSATISIALTSADGSQVLTPSQTINVTFTPATTKSNSAAKPTLTLSKSSLNLDMGGSKTGSVTASVTPSGASVTWASDNEAVATVSPSGKTPTITGKAIGVAHITATATVGSSKVTKTIPVYVKGTVTKLAMTSSTGGSATKWDANASTPQLTLARGNGTQPSASFSVTTNAPISNNAALVWSMTGSNQKTDVSKYLSCTVTGNTLKITAVGTIPADYLPITVRVWVKSKDGTVDLTSGSKFTFTVQSTGSDSGVNIGGVLPNS